MNQKTKDRLIDFAVIAFGLSICSQGRMPFAVLLAAGIIMVLNIADGRA